MSLLLAAFGVGLLAGAQQVEGDEPVPPLVIPYQGVLEFEGHLVDTQGQGQGVTFYACVQDGQGARLWPAAPGGGEPVPWEVHEGVPVHGGRFSLQLGSQVSLPPNLFDGSPRLLHLQVEYAGSGTVDMGQQQLLSSPWAMTAGRSNTVQSIQGNIQQQVPEIQGGANWIGPDQFTWDTVTTYPSLCVTDPNGDSWASVQKDTVRLMSTANSLCFLTTVESASHANHYGTYGPDVGMSCRIYAKDGVWVLHAAAQCANVNCLSQQVCCDAACIRW